MKRLIFARTAIAISLTAIGAFFWWQYFHTGLLFPRPRLSSRPAQLPMHHRRHSRAEYRNKLCLRNALIPPRCPHNRLCRNDKRRLRMDAAAASIKKKPRLFGQGFRARIIFSLSAAAGDFDGQLSQPL
jgi:hypothetical protein